MTILYKPVEIESAAQAEALPEGTIMFLPAGPYVWTARDPGGEFLDHYGRPWHFENTQDDEPFTALVPIEAEEQRITSKLLKHPPSLDDLRAFQAGETPADRTRLVTPWEAIR